MGSVRRPAAVTAGFDWEHFVFREIIFGPNGAKQHQTRPNKAKRLNKLHGCMGARLHRWSCCFPSESLVFDAIVDQRRAVFKNAVGKRRERSGNELGRRRLG
jgi:hypothetical protein